MKVTKSPVSKIIGDKKGSLRTVKNMICIRKAMGSRKLIETRIKNKYKLFLGIVSSPNFHRAESASLINLWCHCYRDPSKYIPKGTPEILLSESDFVDPLNMKIFNRKKPKWDMFYFTIAGQNGIDYKGIDLFSRILPVICGELNLKVIIVVYAGDVRRLRISKKYKNLFKKYKKMKLIVIRKKMNANQVAKIMASCKFGLFPNRLDCSPLLITESLVRNCPVLVNKDIFGGWKYVNDDTGAFFDDKDIGDKVEYMLSSKFNPCDNFMSEYGFLNSATKLAMFCKDTYPSLRKYNMMSLYGTKWVYEKYRTKI